MSWYKLGWVESDSVELCWVGMNYDRLGWGGELGSDGSSWCASWAELTKVALTWFELSSLGGVGSGCIGLGWVEVVLRGIVLG